MIFVKCRVPVLPITRPAIRAADEHYCHRRASRLDRSVLDGGGARTLSEPTLGLSLACRAGFFDVLARAPAGPHQVEGPGSGGLDPGWPAGTDEVFPRALLRRCCTRLQETLLNRVERPHLFWRETGPLASTRRRGCGMPAQPVACTPSLATPDRSGGWRSARTADCSPPPVATRRRGCGIDLGSSAAHTRFNAAGRP